MRDASSWSFERVAWSHGRFPKGTSALKRSDLFNQVAWCTKGTTRTSDESPSKKWQFTDVALDPGAPRMRRLPS
jgi:hypothetical protein